MEVLAGLAGELSPDHEAFRHVRYQVVAEDLRPGATGAPCPVSHVVFPSYRAGSATRLEPIARAAAMMRLAEQTFNRGTMGESGMRALGRVVSAAECHELRFDDLDEAIGMIRGVLDRATIVTNGSSR
jgi:hypothetical protein